MKIYCPEWMTGLTNELSRMTKGETVKIDGNYYSLCSECKSVVKVNKTFFGSLHFCTVD